MLEIRLLRPVHLCQFPISRTPATYRRLSCFPALRMSTHPPSPPPHPRPGERSVREPSSHTFIDETDIQGYYSVRLVVR